MIAHSNFRTVCGDGAGADAAVELVDQRILDEKAVARALDCKKLDRIDSIIASKPQIELKLHHIFTNGLYTRECFIPKGTICTTKIHRCEHPFVISMGLASVWTKDTGWRLVGAPFTGITRPGTRRLIVAHEDTLWSTFHVTNETDLVEIEKKLIEPHSISANVDESFLSELQAMLTP